MRIIPLGDHVVVKRLVPEEKTAGGIVLPTSSQSLPQQGRVLSTGDGRSLPNGNRVEPRVGEGDTVIFPLHAGQDLQVDGQSFLILREDDILAIVR